jgi:hypothetical protein
MRWPGKSGVLAVWGADARKLGHNNGRATEFSQWYSWQHMSVLSGKIYIPPFAGVRLYECWDRLTLTPVPAFREFFAYGKVKATEATIELEDGKTELFWENCAADEEVWAVVQWTRFEDGHEEKGSISYLRSPNTEEDARRAMQRMSDFYSLNKEELLGLARCFKAKEDDYAYIESRYPNYQFPPADAKAIEEYNLYQARLKVVAAMHPKTVELIMKVDATSDPQRRQKLEREAVQAYFAEVATYWTDDLLMAWQRNNPVGSKWLCEFARMIEEPERELDPINHELALNWLRRGYNLLTENELSDAILIATGQRLMPGTLKKRRERLGLTTTRQPGPRPNPEQ